ncbi:MAG TPA: magnesium transporter [bacterium]|nr:magnesium transporter [bacterium]HPQ65978.1 magnesium transporter [bacterium]
MDQDRHSLEEAIRDIRLEESGGRPPRTSPAALAESLSGLDEARKTETVAALAPAEAGEVLWKADRSSRAEIVQRLDDERLGRICSSAAPDRAADFLRLLPPRRRGRVLPLLVPRQEKLVRRLLSFPPDSAGARMSPDVVPFDREMTVDQAVARMREHESQGEIFHCYVVDGSGKLLGVVPMRKLLTASGSTRLGEMIRPFVVSVRTDMDQEEVARVATRHVIYALPVVDEEGKLVGSITLDKVLRVIQEEATEDMYKMAGTDQKEIVSESVFRIARIRAPWLFASWMGGLGASLIIGVFEESIARVAALAAFLPIVLGMGGNIGTQSATVVVRGLAMGYIDVNALGRTVFREMRIGVILGMTYGVLLGVFATVLHYRAYGINLGFTVGTAIFCSMCLAATMGTFIPMLLRRLNVDPAIATGPFVTTSIDILGIVAYFTVASLILL